MTRVEYPSKRFGEIIRRINDARDVVHDNGTAFFPILDGKVLDVNVTRALGGDLGVDHFEGGSIFNVDWGWFRLGMT